MGLPLTPYLSDPDLQIFNEDALAVLSELPAESVRACVTSPPYLDARPEYDSPTVSEFASIFEQLARVLTDCCLVNVGRIWRKGIEQLWWTDLLNAASHSGWHHLDTLVWIKPNANPIHGAVFANRHEYVLILGRPGDRLNEDAIRAPYAASSVPRMRRGWVKHVGVKGDAHKKQPRKSEPHPLGGRPPSYVEVYTGGEKHNAHPAPMPTQLASHLVALASWPGDTIIDPFAGSGTTAVAARKLGRNAILIDSNADYCALAARRTQQLSLEASA